MALRYDLKQTEIGVIPKDWITKSIDEIADVVGGGTPSTSIAEFWNGDIDWFTPTEIKQQKFFSHSVRKITPAGLSFSSAKLLPVGAVLMTSRASIGDLGILDNTACTNQGFQSLIVYEKFDNEYVYYVMHLRKKTLLALASGSTFLEVSPNTVRNLLIPLPPDKNEQSKIANTLSDVDELISRLEKLIVKKRQLKQGVMQSLFNPLNEGGELKDGWKEESLGSLSHTFTKQTGFDYSANIKPNLVKRNEKSVIPFIQNKDFNGPIVNYKTDYFIPLQIAKGFPRILLDEKCLLISISGKVGNVGLFNGDRTAFLGGAIAVAKFKDKLKVDWVMYYLQSTLGQDSLLINVKAGSHQNLILDDLRKIEIPFPPKNERENIVRLCFDLDAEILGLESKLAKTRDLKQGMMQALLTGRIRLIEPYK